MKSLTLKRVATNNDGTFGVLIDELVPFALTLELPWENNLRNKSCIPSGTYSCKRIVSPKFGNTFTVQEVSNRTHILFHRGNVEEDTEGCILIGEQFEYLHDKIAILGSRKGFGEFMGRLAGEELFSLLIAWT